MVRPLHLQGRMARPCAPFVDHPQGPDLPIETRGEDLTTVANFSVSEGQLVPFLLIWHPSHEPPPQPIDALGAVKDTEEWWQEWSARCTYKGEWQDHVLRSLITLKALTYRSRRAGRT